MSHFVPCMFSRWPQIVQRCRCFRYSLCRFEDIRVKRDRLRKKHIIETLIGFENGIETNRSSLDKECSQIENKIALEKSKAISRLNELEASLKTKLHRLRNKNEVIMTDELVKIKDINSQAKETS